MEVPAKTFTFRIHAGSTLTLSLRCKLKLATRKRDVCQVHTAHRQIMRVAFRAAQHLPNVTRAGQSLRHSTAFLRSPFPRQRPWHLTHVRNQRRGAKSKAIVQLKELPQGPLGGQEALVEAEDEAPAYPPVVQQAWNNMQKFEDCVVVTRVGNFYEVRWRDRDMREDAECRGSFTSTTQTNMVPSSTSKWPRRRLQPAPCPWLVYACDKVNSYR